MTWDRRLYFPSKGRRDEEFFRPKNPMASAGFEPASLATKGQHATPRPSKPIIDYNEEKSHEDTKKKHSTTRVSRSELQLHYNRQAGQLYVELDSHIFPRDRHRNQSVPTPQLPLLFHHHSCCVSHFTFSDATVHII